MARNYLNNVPATALNGGVNDTTTTWTVDSSTGYPSTDFTAKCESEVVLVTNVSGVTWTVTRGYDNTTGATHADGLEVRAVIVADDLDRTWIQLPLAGGDMTGAIGGYQGSDAAPTFSFKDDPDTGMGGGWGAGMFFSDDSYRVLDLSHNTTGDGSTSAYFKGYTSVLGLDTGHANQSDIGKITHYGAGTAGTTQRAFLKIEPAQFHNTSTGTAQIFLSGESEDATQSPSVEIEAYDNAYAHHGSIVVGTDQSNMYVSDSGGISGVRVQIPAGTPSIAFLTDGTDRFTISSTALYGNAGTGAPYLTYAVGTAGNPAFAFNADTDTGMYRTGANVIGFSTGSTLRLSISSSGLTSTVPVLTSDGSKSLPSYSFASDTNTGIYSTANGVISFSSNDTLVAEITADGITAGVPGFVTFGVEGALATGTGTQRWYAPYDLDITRATLALGTVSSSGNVEVDVHRDGTTIFTTQTLRPICASSSNFDASGAPNGTTAMTKDTNYLTIDWDAIGTGAADATVTVEFIST